jgi:4-hydroxy-tetrahydrodipicolinate synthase
MTNNTSTVNFSGCGTALVTPFRNGEVDYNSYIEIVRDQVNAGIDFLVPLGTTSEAPCLSVDEAIALLDITKANAGNLPLLVGAGNNSLTQTVQNMRALSGHGADAFLIVVPFYNKPTQEGLIQYFTAVAEASEKPIVLYNIPGRTGTNMQAETTLRLAEHPNIIAVKEASGNEEQIRQLIDNAPADFKVFSGNDDETLKLTSIGAAGIISVASNIAPRAMVSLIKAIKSGNMAEAVRLNDLLSPLFKNCFLESNPIPVKAGLSILGKMANELRLPLVPASQPVFEAMKQTIEGLKANNLI